MLISETLHHVEGKKMPILITEAVGVAADLSCQVIAGVDCDFVGYKLF